jgi:hypothetical protein
MSSYNMNKISLNDLPLWSPWPVRLLGLDSWTVPTRSTAKIDQEYNSDKYAKCLDHRTQTGAATTPEDVKQFEFGLGSSTQICIAIGNDLYAVSLAEARERYYDLLLSTIGAVAEKCKSVVELGAGYGYNLWMLQQHLIGHAFSGGEYSENAVQLAAHLYQDTSSIQVHNNFYDEQSYSFLEAVEPPIAVFTSHAIEQLPGSSPIFDYLLPYKDRIQVVFHLEPTYETYGETLMGLMRRRYVELNDYNRDLLSELRRRSYIQVLDTHENVFGLNPLNPTSIIQWEFVP